MIIGISEGFHDAAIYTICDGEILYVSHAERHSKVKNDKHLHSSMEIKGTTVFYENPFLKNLRRLYV